MKYVHKAAVAALASIGLIAAASTASAQSVSPVNTDVQASGILDVGVSVFGFPVRLGQCDITLYGTTRADGSGIDFDDYDGETLSGVVDCSDGLDPNIEVNTVAGNANVVNIPWLQVTHTLGTCSGVPGNVPFANSSVTVNNATLGDCFVSGTLTVSPAITIN